MRKIKFRAWHNIEHKMIYGTELKYVTWFDEFGELRSLGPVTLMQYTGLTDKDGKELYEGDILNHANNWKHVVKWNDKKAGFEPFCNWKVGQYDIPREYSSFESTNEIEVIGNIYEDKDLLE